MNELMCIYKIEKWILKLSLVLFLFCLLIVCCLCFVIYVESRYLDNIYFKSLLF